MYIGHPGGIDHLFGVKLAETGDVLADAAFEQFDVLGQVADMRAEFMPIPGKHIGTVQPDLAVGGRPNA